ncbi:hypothetical protein NL533_34405, partial [Klebsiella pneumoniae]|nr:hypothetical protein [Klebsiella pneumoniae]
VHMERSYSDVRTESLPTVGGETVQSETRQRAGASALNLLFAAALFTDLFLPVLITQGWIPAEARWLSHAALAAMIVGAVLRI